MPIMLCYLLINMIVILFQAIFLDDIGPNVKSARALGISTILVKNSKKALEELKELSGIDVSCYTFHKWFNLRGIHNGL